MASKRIAKSSVDWAAFALRVPESQKPFFQSFKTKSDAYLRRMMSNPEVSPKIDWAYYQKNIAKAGLADEFQKKYEALKIPYPQDTLTAEVNKQEKEAAIVTKEFIDESNNNIMKHKKELDKWAAIIPFEEMTLEEFAENFPDLAMDDLNRPTVWPHEQPDESEVEGTSK